MKFALFTAYRYIRSKKDNTFISKLMLISILTVSLSIMLPIIVLSIVNGFHYSIETKILSFDFHINIKDRNNNFTSYKEVLKDIKQDHNINLAIPFFQSQGFIKNNYEGKIYFVTIKAFHNKDIEQNSLFRENFKIIDDKRIIFEEAILKDLPNLSNQANNKTFQLSKPFDIIIGDTLANILGVFRGDSINLFIPQGDIQLDKDPSAIKTFTISNLYSAGYARFDKNIVFINFSSISKVFAFEDIPSDIGILLKDKSYLNTLSKYLENKYPNLQVSSVMNEGIFKDFAKEKKLMFIILFFLVIASFLTIYISIYVIIIDKRIEIGILKTVGISSYTIELIFILEGILISFVGVILGSSFGILITISLHKIIRFIEYLVNFMQSAIFRYFGELTKMDYPSTFYIMNPNVFYLDSLPYKIYYTDILILSIGSIFMSIVAAYFPSKKFSKEKAIISFWGS